MKKWPQALTEDLKTNHLRYNGLLLLFFLVYFGDVAVAKMAGGLSSTERILWEWWFLGSFFGLIPAILSLGLALAGLIALAFIALTENGQSLTTTISTAVFVLVLSLVVNFVSRLWKRS